MTRQHGHQRLDEPVRPDVHVVTARNDQIPAGRPDQLTPPPVVSPVDRRRMMLTPVIFATGPVPHIPEIEKEDTPAGAPYRHLKRGSGQPGVEDEQPGPAFARGPRLPIGKP